MTTTSNGTTTGRAWLNGTDLCAVCQITWATLHKLVDLGLIAPVDAHGPRTHWRFPASAAVTIRNLRKAHGRQFVRAVRAANRQQVATTLVPEDVTIVDAPDLSTLDAQIAAINAAADVERAQRERVADDVLMLFGIDEQLKAMTRVLERVAVALERCATAWER